MTDPIREHIRLLSIFHYVVGGLGYLFSMIPFIHLSMGIFFLLAPEAMLNPPAARPSVSAVELESGNPQGGGESGTATAPISTFPARLVGVLFVAIPSVIILCGFALSTAIVMAGRRLAACRSHQFCLVVAGIECLFTPFGTVLGVFTLLTLLKPEARACFGLAQNHSTPGIA